MMIEQKRVSFDLDTITDDGVVKGYGAVFNNVDRGGDVILPGAFKRWLLENAGKPLKMLWNHFESFPLGKWTKFEEDEKGLRIEGKFTLAAQKAQEIYALMKDGVIDGLSIGYQTVDAEEDKTTGVRRLKELRLFEISPVTFPMNTEATADFIKAETISAELLRQMSIRDIEATLTGKRDAVRFSRNAALLLMKGDLPALHQAKRDAGEEAVHRMAQALLSELKAIGTGP